MLDDASDRRFKAKRSNEYVKAVYALLNTLPAGVIGAAFIVPAVTGTSIASEVDRPGWVLIGLSLHVMGHGVIWRFWRRED